MAENWLGLGLPAQASPTNWPRFKCKKPTFATVFVENSQIGRNLSRKGSLAEPENACWQLWGHGCRAACYGGADAGCLQRGQWLGCSGRPVEGARRGVSEMQAALKGLV